MPFDALIGLATALFLSTSALGAGAAMLHLSPAARQLDAVSYSVFSGIVGLGIMGWLVFPLAVAGLISTPILIAAHALPILGLLKLPWKEFDFSSPPAPGVIIFAAVLCIPVILFDLAEGLSPPVDGDSLAYHFALPIRFIDAGQLVFIPEAIDGAVPLLQQMTYLSAFAIGGEPGGTLWVMISGWLAPLAVFAVLRNLVPIYWAIAAAVVVVATPAFIYGAGSGQVEARNAAFVIVAAVMVFAAIRTKDPTLAIIAGLAAGFFAGSKYTGLLFVFACAVVLLRSPSRTPLIIGYSIAAFVAGSQWYFWNWWNTGDPVFPLFFNILPYVDGVWSETAANLLKADTSHELVYGKSPFGFLSYVWSALFAAKTLPDSLRVGLGPFLNVALVFVLLGAWLSFQSNKSDEKHRACMYYGLIAGLFIGLWFVLGSSQRIRHIVPVLPILIICTFVMIDVVITRYRLAMGPAIVMVSGVCCIQFAGHYLFSAKYMGYVFSDQSKDAYLERNIRGYNALKWVRQNIDPQDMIVIPRREWRYFLENPHILATSTHQAHLEPLAIPPEQFWQKLHSAAVQYLITPLDAATPSGYIGYQQNTERLYAVGCMEEVARFDGTSVESRTLRSVNPTESPHFAYRLKSSNCVLNLSKNTGS